MPNILFSARPELWPQYQPVLEAAFAARGIDARLMTEADAPETVDFMIYAPARDDEDLSAFSNVKLIQSLWAGPDKLLENPTLTQPLARMVDPSMTQGMVDYVMGHVLRHHLHTDRFERAQPGDWRATEGPPLARDRVVCFLGLGELGMACARAAQAHGFSVSGWSRRLKDNAGFPCFAGEEGLTQALAGADIVVTLLPRTPATENLLDAVRIAQMKPGAAIVNPGRGELIDDDALLAALDNGHLSGATLDVFRVEPLPAEHRYWTHPKVLVTPHVGTETRVASASEIAVDNIARVIRGEPAHHLIDRTRNY